MAQIRKKAGTDVRAAQAEACEALRLDNQLCFALYTASRLLIQAYQPWLEPLGLTYPQYVTLLVLWEEDGLTLSALGGRLSLDSGTLSPLLKKLEQKGLLTRERSLKDERSVHLRLTQSGRDLRRRAFKIPGQLACAIELPLPGLLRLKQDLVSLTAGLRRSLAAG
jgi:MarR family transcriptional regulator, organic hydroperoxide resistance regulator